MRSLEIANRVAQGGRYLRRTTLFDYWMSLPMHLRLRAARRRMIDVDMIHVRCIHQDDARFWKSSLAYFFEVHAIDDAEQAEIIRQLVSTKRYMSKDGLWTLTVVKR